MTTAEYSADAQCWHVEHAAITIETIAAASFDELLAKQDGARCLEVSSARKQIEPATPIENLRVADAPMQTESEVTECWNRAE